MKKKLTVAETKEIIGANGWTPWVKPQPDGGIAGGANYTWNT